MNGYKLKGSWVLVRTSGRYAGRAGNSPGTESGSDGRSWLLIKHRDEWSGDLDIAEFAPRSVKSDGELEDILARRQSGHLDVEPARQGRRNRRDVRRNHRARGQDQGYARTKATEGQERGQVSTRREVNPPPRDEWRRPSPLRPTLPLSGRHESYFGKFVVAAAIETK